MSYANNVVCHPKRNRCSREQLRLELLTQAEAVHCSMFHSGIDHRLRRVEQSRVVQRRSHSSINEGPNQAEANNSRKVPFEDNSMNITITEMRFSTDLLEVLKTRLSLLLLLLWSHNWTTQMMKGWQRSLTLLKVICGGGCSRPNSWTIEAVLTTPLSVARSLEALDGSVALINATYSAICFSCSNIVCTDE